jgi:competence protein ComEA
MKNLPQIGNILIGFLLGVISVGVINLVTSPPRGRPIELNPPPTPSPIRVHVNGAIENPGVYTLPADAITQDAIDAAGGVSDGAYLDNINLASQLKDGAQIYVPSLNENEGETTLSSSPTNPTHPRININTAAASDLELLPGIGPSLAQKIIEFRQENGPFETIEDLLDVSGIGPSKLEEIRDHVTIR